MNKGDFWQNIDNFKMWMPYLTVQLSGWIKSMRYKQSPRINRKT